MQRLFAILVLGFLALGLAGMSPGSAGAGPATCAPDAATLVDDVMAEPVALAENGTTLRRSIPQGQQLACNSRCARQCAGRRCAPGDRECRREFSRCVRSCGC